MGFAWFVFRIKYALLKQFNYFDKINNNILKKVNNKEDLFMYKKIGLISSHFKGYDSFIKKADEAMKGNIFSFSNEYLDYNENGTINWQMNPISKVKADVSLSWNHLEDFGEYGDIKLIWEASRFPQIYFFINAYAVSKNEKYAHTCISQIIDWIDSNPYPKGVNYKCGQEISFRIFTWINALEYFYQFISKEDEKKIVQNIYTSFLRVDANIDYAAKSVKNNHSLSEAGGLLIIGLLFPQFKESKKLLDKGLKYLLKETAYQVYADGSYIQHSFIYQRLALDVLSFVFLVADKKQFKIPNILRERQQKMIVFLNLFMQVNGYLPNYGSNDGANLFPINNSDYLDFRTSLNFAMGKSDFFNLDKKENESLNKKIEFNDGGYYILKNENIFSFIRCHSYRNRPAQNDMFHLDVWYRGENIFCDTGSYSYNTDKKFKEYFVGVKAHNTVMINHANQMRRVLNFGYTNWTKAKCLFFDEKSFRGIHYAYKKDFNIEQERSIELEKYRIVVLDKIKNVVKKTNIQQIWHTKFDVKIIDDYTVQVNHCMISSNVKHKIEESYISDYYHAYQKGKSIIFEIDTDTNYEIKTIMEFKV